MWKLLVFIIFTACSELFWSVFFHIPTEYGEIRSISRFSVRMRENADQDNSEYGHFSRSDYIGIWDHMSPRFAKSQKIKSDITNQHLDIFVKIFWPHYIYIHCNFLCRAAGPNFMTKSCLAVDSTQKMKFCRKGTLRASFW